MGPAVLVVAVAVSGCATSGGSSRHAAAAPAAVEAPASIPGDTSAELGDRQPTLIVMLGTGTPNPDPERAGPAAAVVAGGRPYLVDCGAGVVRRAEAAREHGIDALAMPKLTRLFLTHLHSDHTLGYADLILTPWVLEREEPLEVYGPPGTRAMTENLLAAYAEDIDVRLHGAQPQNATGIEVEVHEIEPGPVYEDDGVRVTAFAVRHGSWAHAFGYRFDTADRSIVISGDTTPTEAVVEACSGCDVLVHEVYAKAGWDRRTPDWQAYHAGSHTSGIELGELAARARPKLLVLTHQLLWGATEDELIAEIRRNFDGEIAFADDLDVY
jgi:ribonuclease BN (tRNA processing enzyme)